jgi:hypothetical protein
MPGRFDLIFRELTYVGFALNSWGIDPGRIRPGGNLGSPQESDEVGILSGFLEGGEFGLGSG